MISSVVVDPNQEQEDRDRTNNSASVGILAPDLTITEIGMQSAGPDRLLTIRVVNEGVLPVTDIDVEVRKGSATGPVLGTFTIPSLVPGAYYDISCSWEAPKPKPTGYRTVYAIVDKADAIAEFDETNNTRTARVPVRRYDMRPVDEPLEPVEAQPIPPP